MTEQELFDHLFKQINDAKEAHYNWFSESLVTEGKRDWKNAPPYHVDIEGYGELTEDVRGYKKGQTLRVVHASCMGDLGCTPDLEAKTGYKIRLMPGEGHLTNCRLTRNP